MSIFGSVLGDSLGGLLSGQPGQIIYRERHKEIRQVTPEELEEIRRDQYERALNAGRQDQLAAMWGRMQQAHRPLDAVQLATMARLRPQVSTPRDELDEICSALRDPGPVIPRDSLWLRFLKWLARRLEP